MPEKDKQTATLSTRRKGTIIFFYILLVFTFQEVVFRICFPLPEVLNFNRIKYQTMAMVSGEEQFLRNSTLTWQSSLDTSFIFEHHLNGYGFRDQSWRLKKDKDKKRIFILGDSFVEGAMSTQENTIPQTFSDLSKNNVEVFNCGMIGVGWQAYLKFLTHAVPLFQPDEVLLIVYANDMPMQKINTSFPELKPELKNPYLPHLYYIFKEILANRPIPFRLLSKKRAFLSPVPSMANPWTLNESEIQQHVSEKVANAMKQGSFNYYRTNWILKEKKALKQERNLEKELSYLKKTLSEYGTTLRIFYLPSRSQVTDHYYQYEKEYCLLNCPPELSLRSPAYQLHRKSLKKQCSQFNIPFYDLTPYVQKKENNNRHLYWNYDDHMKGYGYRLLGKKIFTDRKNSAL